MASRIARWANDEQQAALLASKPVKGDIGIIVVPESQLWSHLLPQAKEGRFYTRCAQGAYRAFLQHNIQADWVRFEHIDEYDRLYLPYPIMLTSEQSEKLKLWVKRGGTLLSEGCTAYFGENGTVGVKQPNYGLHDMFGAVQREVEFMPDLGSRIEFESCGLRVKGGLFRQSYTATAGTVLGTYADGSAAVVEHTYGEGRTVLIGTFPSEAFDRTQDEATGLFFVRLLERSAAHVHWGSFDGSLDNNRFSAVVPAKDALVLQLQDF
jgi:beta-galactosidase